MPRFISFRDDGKDRWKIGSGGDAKKEEKNVESEVTVCPLEPRKMRPIPMNPETTVLLYPQIAQSDLRSEG